MKREASNWTVIRGKVGVMGGRAEHDLQFGLEGPCMCNGVCFPCKKERQFDTLKAAGYQQGRKQTEGVCCAALPQPMKLANSWLPSSAGLGLPG